MSVSEIISSPSLAHEYQLGQPAYPAPCPLPPSTRTAGCPPPARSQPASCPLLLPAHVPANGSPVHRMLSCITHVPRSVCATPSDNIINHCSSQGTNHCSSQGHGGRGEHRQAEPKGAPKHVRIHLTGGAGPEAGPGPGPRTDGEHDGQLGLRSDSARRAAEPTCQFHKIYLQQDLVWISATGPVADIYTACEHTHATGHDTGERRTPVTRKRA